MTDFQSSSNICLIKTIPTDQIIRYILKIIGFIIEAHLIKIYYRCDICKAEIQNETVCNNGCFIKNPILNMHVFCMVQDGTAKASLYLRDEKVIQAFSITETHQRMFKDYCLKYGAFKYPCQYNCPLYREVFSAFNINFKDVWSQHVFYCKPYYKQDYRIFNTSKTISKTISKPSFLNEGETDIEIFLNGEFQVWISNKD
jgi:hypothetical protein